MCSRDKKQVNVAYQTALCLMESDFMNSDANHCELLKLSGLTEVNVLDYSDWHKTR